MRKLLLGIVAAVGLTICGSITVNAQETTVNAQEMSHEAFRSLLHEWFSALEDRGADVALGGKSLSQKVLELDDEQLELLYKAYADKKKLQEAVDGLTSMGEAREPSALQAAPLALTEMSFPPAYPNPDTEPSYGFILGQLESNALNPISDTNGDGNFNDERCTAEYESATWISLTTAQTADNFVGLVCDADLEPISRGICFAAAVVTLGGVLATEILVGQCELQDALVDAAEIEAGYENTVSLLANLDEHDDNLAQHDTDIKARLDTIEGKVDTAIVYILDSIRLLHTPQGRRTSTSPACDGGPCSFPTGQ